MVDGGLRAISGSGVAAGTAVRLESSSQTVPVPPLLRRKKTLPSGASGGMIAAGTISSVQVVPTRAFADAKLLYGLPLWRRYRVSGTADCPAGGVARAQMLRRYASPGCRAMNWPNWKKPLATVSCRALPVRALVSDTMLDVIVGVGVTQACT